MQIIFDTNTILLVCLLIITLFGFIGSFHHVKQLHTRIDQMMYTIWRLSKDYHNLEEPIQDIYQHTKQLHEGFDLIEQAFNLVHQEKHMPSPQEAQQIDATVRDLLTIEIMLSSDMKISKRDSVPNVIKETIRTYPDVNEKYIVKKALSVIETFVKES